MVQMTKKMSTYCVACGKRIKEGDEAILTRVRNNGEDKNIHPFKFMILCPDEVEYFNMRSGTYRKIIFGAKKEVVK